MAAVARRWRWKPVAVALGVAATVPTALYAFSNNRIPEDCGDDDPLSHQEHERKGFLEMIAEQFHRLSPGKVADSGSGQAFERVHGIGNLVERLHDSQHRALEDDMEFKKHGLDPPTFDLAKEFSSEVRVIRQEAEQLLKCTPLPHSSRFTDAEIMRYALHYGFLRARDASGRERALHQSAQAIVATVKWQSTYQFSSDEDLERFKHLVWWSNDEVSGRFVLHVAVDKAVNECRGHVALEFANAVITQMQRAIETRLKDDAPQGLDRVDVVVYAGGTSALSASRVAWVLKSLVSTLSHHFPGRLHELRLLDLPRVLTWLVRGVKKLVHSETARKVQSLPSSSCDVEAG